VARARVADHVAVATQPSGTVTLLFSDIEGSTRLLERLGTETYADVLEQHRRLLREVFAQHEGYEVDTEGDAFFVAFARAGDAVSAAEEGQRALGTAAWPEGVEVRVRMGLHTGEPVVVDANYVGMDVHRAARIMTAGHGGQVLLSQATRVLVDGRDFRDLGDHRLKDFDQPVRLFQVGTADFPRPKTLNNTNLPVPASSFVGRERELTEVTSLLRNGTRLATLTGPGGSGKTRLALEAAGDVVGDYPDGVFWVGLASLREPALVVETIGQTLDTSGGLSERIGDRSLLLVLDNFEQVIDAAVDMSVLLGECRNLRLLVTSRELLRLQGEVEYQVPPLEQDEAEDLFCARSRLPRDDEIADLCRHLDDLPLAVELAAARTAVLSPREIRDRLSQRLDLFKGGRDADPRQQTLRATIEWSYELLGEPERQLFARLAVFAGGCTLDAAEEIVDADVDGLQSLVDKSLVRRTGGRFWMLETIGELARERLQASDDADEIGRRHAEWFLALAERAEQRLKGSEQPVWLQRLEDDHDNLRKSLDWLFDHDERELAVRLAGVLWLFWYMHGHVSEARRWLRRALDVAADEPTEARAKVLDGAGYLAAEQEDLDEAIPLLEASLSCAKEIEATSAAAIAAAHLGAIRARSQRSGKESRRAIAEGEEAVALARQAGDDYVLAVALNNLGGSTLMLLQDRERTSAYWAESLEIRRRIGDMSRIALSLCNLGWMALLEGRVDRASSLFAEGAEIAGGIGDKRQVSGALAGLAWVAYLEQRREEADSLARESLAIMRELGMKGGYVDAMFCLAGAAAARGDLARGARLAAAAELCYSLFGSIDIADEARYRAVVESARAACDPEAWERESAVGRAMGLDEAVEYALSPA
jgi:predicted ATPase/class 3 adenylate cyclase